MKIGEIIKFIHNEKIYSGKFLEKQLAMFPEYTEANENEIKIEIEDANMRKELGMGRKKCLVIDEKNILVNKIKKSHKPKKMKF